VDVLNLKVSRLGLFYIENKLSEPLGIILIAMTNNFLETIIFSANLNVSVN